MASACFLANEPGEARRYAQMALSQIGEMSSHRTWDRLRQMYGLSSRSENVAEVSELRAEIRSSMPARPRPQIV